jgi:hypothetical protein
MKVAADVVHGLLLVWKRSDPLTVDPNVYHELRETGTIRRDLRFIASQPLGAGELAAHDFASLGLVIFEKPKKAVKSR